MHVALFASGLSNHGLRHGSRLARLLHGSRASKHLGLTYCLGTARHRLLLTPAAVASPRISRAGCTCVLVVAAAVVDATIAIIVNPSTIPAPTTCQYHRYLQHHSTPCRTSSRQLIRNFWFWICPMLRLQRRVLSHCWAPRVLLQRCACRQLTYSEYNDVTSATHTV